MGDVKYIGKLGEFIYDDRLWEIVNLEEKFLSLGKPSFGRHEGLHYCGPIVCGKIQGEVPNCKDFSLTFSNCKGLRYAPDIPLGKYRYPFYGCCTLEKFPNKWKHLSKDVYLSLLEGSNCPKYFILSQLVGDSFSRIPKDLVLTNNSVLTALEAMVRHEDVGAYELDGKILESFYGRFEIFSDREVEGLEDNQIVFFNEIMLVFEDLVSLRSIGKRRFLVFIGDYLFNPFDKFGNLKYKFKNNFEGNLMIDNLDCASLDISVFNKLYVRGRCRIGSLRVCSSSLLVMGENASLKVMSEKLECGMYLNKRDVQLRTEEVNVEFGDIEGNPAIAPCERTVFFD